MHRLFDVIRLCIAALIAAATCHAANGAAHPAQTLLTRANALLSTEPDAGKRHVDAALALLSTQPDPDLEIAARLLLCDYLAERDRVAANEQVLAMNAQLPHVKRIGLRAGVTRCQGKLQEVDGDIEQALALYEQAVVYATASNDREMLAEVLTARGDLRSAQGDFTASLTDLRRAEELFDEAGHSARAVTTLNNIAVLYSRMGDNAQAIAIFQRALKGQRAENLHREQAITLTQLARAHSNLHQWRDAAQAFDTSLNIARGLNYHRGQAQALLGLAVVATAEGDAEKSLQLLDAAALSQQQSPDVLLSAQINLARGTALRRLERYADSATALRLALPIFKRAGSLAELAVAHAELAAVYGALSRWRAAFEQQVEAQAASEQLLKNQLDQRFTTLKVEFDAASKEKENVLLLRENQANANALQAADQANRLQNWVIALAIMLACVLAGIAWHQRSTQLRMRILALTDELTRVPNRRAVLTRLAPLLQDTESPACALLIVDIDHFKSINDRHGHSVGDEALKQVAMTLKESVREPAFVGRLGGEEFVVVLPDANLMNASEVGERLRVQVMNIDASRWKDGKPITVSIGVAVSRPGDTPSEMLQRADAALYVAKNDGRNCVRTELATDRKA